MQEFQPPEDEAAGSVPPAEPPPPPEPGVSSDPSGKADPARASAAVLAEYLSRHQKDFTTEALRRAAAEAGYDAATIDAAFARSAATAGAAPVRARARLIVLAAYGLTFLVLTAGMAVNGNANGGVLILAASLGVTLVPSLFGLRGRKSDGDRAQLAMGGLLAVPIILLVIVGGLCVATGLPTHRLTF